MARGAPPAGSVPALSDEHKGWSEYGGRPRLNWARTAQGPNQEAGRTNWLADRGEGVPTRAHVTLPRMRRMALAAVILAGLAVPAAADFEAGLAAIERGDYRAALRELRPLAEQGHAQAQYKLGRMYRAGVGVPRDAAAAANWTRRAAEQGDALAQYDLGIMYATGQGVAEDHVQAHLWFDLAAMQEDVAFRVSSRAASIRDLVAEEMTAAQVDEAQRLARDWLAKHPTKQ